MYRGHYIPLKHESKCTRADLMALYPDVALRLPESLIRCQAIVLANTDRADIGHHVLFRRSSPMEDAQEPLPATQVGRVEEILADADSGRICGVLVRHCVVGPPVLPYRMPSCRAMDTTAELVVFEVRFKIIAVS